MPLSQGKGSQVPFSVFRVTLAAGRRRPRLERAELRVTGWASTDGRSEQCRGGNIPGSSRALPCPLIKGLATMSPHAVLWAQRGPITLARSLSWDILPKSSRK